MTPQDTPPPLDLDPFRKWFANGETHSDRLGLLLVAEVERLRGVDQGKGVRDHNTDPDLQMAARYAYRKFSEWCANPASNPSPGLCLAIDQLGRAAEAKQSKAPTPNPKAKDGEA